MRYKVKAPTAESYDELVRFLEASDVDLFVRSPKRRFVSTGDLPGHVRSEIRTRGGLIAAEQQHEPDRREFMAWWRELRGNR